MQHKQCPVLLLKHFHLPVLNKMSLNVHLFSIFSHFFSSIKDSHSVVPTNVRKLDYQTQVKG